MAIEIEHFTAADFDAYNKDTYQNYISPDLAFIVNTKGLSSEFFRLSCPLELAEGRFVRIVSGEVTYIINMQRYHLHAFDVIIIPEGAVLEVAGFSDDHALQAVTLKHLPADATVNEPQMLSLDNHDWQRLSTYLSVLYQTVHQPSFDRQSVRYLLAAMVRDMLFLASVRQHVGDRSNMNRREQVFNRFIRLVNEHGATEHRIAFYADALCISPNHLSNIVKDTSGHTTAYWIDQAVVRQAKLLLAHSDKMIYEIADELKMKNASFFGKFFKRQTGLTPGEYRNKKE